jgi:streptomycin 6-kinase
MPVTCTDLIFQGAVQRCAVTTAGGDELIAHIESDRPVKEARTGAALWAYWESGAARLLSRET